MAGRKPHSRELSVWSNGERVGTWRIPTRGDMELEYAAAWTASTVGRPLSLSLPFTVDNLPLKGDRVNSYFENLLPDSEPIRRRLATKMKAASTGAFDLLAAIGRDCVGAVQLLPEDGEPAGFDKIEGKPMTDEDVEQYLVRTTTADSTFMTMGFDADDFRISLAGAQEKTALLWHKNQWMLPHGATPTTHILKLPLGLVGNSRVNLTTSVENEWLCLNILQAYGLPVANSRIMDFGRQRVLCVERFDRRLHSSGTWWMRLPQEDFCQALGKPPHLKYEADGGPGVKDLAAILRHSQNARADMETLLTAQILFWMLAAPDGHAKNFSIQLLPGGRYHLTSLYDVVSIWPIEGNADNQWSWHKGKMAMAITGKNKHYLFQDIQRRHFNAMASQCGYGKDAEPIIGRLLERTDSVVQEVAARLPAGFPQQVASSIFKGLKTSAEKLHDMAP